MKKIYTTLMAAALAVSATAATPAMHVSDAAQQPLTLRSTMPTTHKSVMKAPATRAAADGSIAGEYVNFYYSPFNNYTDDQRSQVVTIQDIEGVAEGEANVLITGLAGLSNTLLGSSFSITGIKGIYDGETISIPLGQQIGQQIEAKASTPLFLLGLNGNSIETSGTATLTLGEDGSLEADKSLMLYLNGKGYYGGAMNCTMYPANGHITYSLDGVEYNIPLVTVYQSIDMNDNIQEYYITSTVKYSGDGLPIIWVRTADGLLAYEQVADYSSSQNADTGEYEFDPFLLNTLYKVNGKYAFVTEVISSFEETETGINISFPQQNPNYSAYEVGGWSFINEAGTSWYGVLTQATGTIMEHEAEEPETEWTQGNVSSGVASGVNNKGVAYTMNYSITTLDEGSLSVYANLVADADLEGLDPQVLLNGTIYLLTATTRGTNYTGTAVIPAAAWGENMNIELYFPYADGGVIANTVNYTVGEVKGGAESGIGSINAQQGAATYYNMQGQRVANPSNGLYIVVRNGKASKEIVK